MWATGRARAAVGSPATREGSEDAHRVRDVRIVRALRTTDTSARCRTAYSPTAPRPNGTVTLTVRAHKARSHLPGEPGGGEPGGGEPVPAGADDPVDLLREDEWAAAEQADLLLDPQDAQHRLVESVLGDLPAADGGQDAVAGDVDVRREQQLAGAGLESEDGHTVVAVLFLMSSRKAREGPFSNPAHPIRAENLCKAIVSTCAAEGFTPRSPAGRARRPGSDARPGRGQACHRASAGRPCPARSREVPGRSKKTGGRQS